MLEGSVNAWLNDTREALAIGQRLGKKVIIIGVSTGGTLATWLAARPATEHVAAYVLISPNYAPADPMSGVLLWPWGEKIAELIIGPEFSWEPRNKLHGKYWTHRYPVRALLPMMGLVSVIESLNLGGINTPVLLIYSPGDRVVDSATIEETFARIGAPRKLLVPYTGAGDPNQHVLAGDILSPGSTKVLAEMIVDFAGKPSP
jgi:alpha-beta hydrolase superfamily lysophospholipase